MPQVSIREQVKKLVDLQVIDVEIYSFKRDLKEKPLVIEQLKAKYEASKSGLKALEEKSKALQVDRKSKELELQSKEEGILKANGQLSALKTNKEYTAKLVEIESLKADKSIVEEKILILFDENDEVVKLIEKEKAAVAEAEKIYLSQKKEVDDAIRDIHEKIKLLEVKRNQIAPEVDKNNLIRYEKILENKDGLAIVPVVKGHSCGGCFMNVPQQVINDMKLHDRFISCEMCARILYLEDDL